jgi:hypothetical protein
VITLTCFVGNEKRSLFLRYGSQKYADTANKYQSGNEIESPVSLLVKNKTNIKAKLGMYGLCP